MSTSNYSTLFVPAVIMPSRRGFKSHENIIDGISFAEHIQLAIESKEAQGYELISTEMVQSAKYHNLAYSEGALLIFKKKLK